jgi:hypothetical protein
MKSQKKLLFLAFFLFLFSTIQAQEEESVEDEGTFEGEEYIEEDYPLNTFLRLSTSVFTVNSNPTDIDFQFWDDDLIDTDSISGFRQTNSLWTYGINFGLGFLIEPDWIINLDTHLGFGGRGRSFNYVGQLGVGKEFKFGSFYIQPSLAFGFVYSSLSLGDYGSDTKGYFEVNDSYIFDDLSVSLRSRAMTISPAVFIEYSIRREISVFAKVSVHYSFWDTHFIALGGETDEVNSDGETITANERINFTERNRLVFNVNNQPIVDKKSPYFPYNFNSTLIQVGISFAFNLLDGYEE